VASIPFAEVPDGFVAETERRNAYLTYANAIGIDPQLIDPDLVASRALGTGAQARVIAEKAEALGLASWEKQFTHELNEWILDDKTTFAFLEKDLTETERRATVFVNDATAVGSLVDRVIITARQGRQLLVDKDELPREFIEGDTTVDESLSDEEKPTDEEQSAVTVETNTAPTSEAITPAIVRLMLGKAVNEAMLEGVTDVALDMIAKARQEGHENGRSAAAMAALGQASAALELAANEPSVVVLQADQAQALAELGKIAPALKEMAQRPIVVQLALPDVGSD
jgi:hypothetical protein